MREPGKYALCYALRFAELKWAVMNAVGKRTGSIVGHDQRNDVRCLTSVLDCDDIVVSYGKHRLCFIEVGGRISKAGFFNFFRGDSSAKLRIVSKVNCRVHSLPNPDLSHPCVRDCS